MAVLAAPAASRAAERSRALGAVVLFTATLFLSASLLFLIEPMVGKMVLPLLGGAPGVWNTCMVFFQAMLLAGYAYAHGSTAWLGVRRHSLAHALLVLVPLFLLPVTIGEAAPVSGNPIVALLSILFVAVGLPFFVLSTTAAVLQKWFSTTDHPSAHDPYFLYVASNLGSLLALVAYPVVVEPVLAVRNQTRLWAIGYAVYAVLGVACAAVVWRQRPAVGAAAARTATADSDAEAVPVGWLARGRWLVLSCVPSSLMLAVTTFMSTDVAAVPLLWIVPLSLYLLTFVLAFSRALEISTRIADRALPLLIVPLTLILVGRLGGPLLLMVPLHLLTFVAAALVCHGALARSRPHTRHLTEFYLWIAIGGMLGGVFNTLVAPVIFTSIAEYPIALVLACLLRPRRATGPGTNRPQTRTIGAWPHLVPAAAGVLTLGVILWANQSAPSARAFVAALGVPAALAFTQRRRPLAFGAAIGLMLLAGIPAQDGYGTVQHAERTFFGVYRVRLDEAGGFRFILHGTTLHGMQRLDPERQQEPLAYFHRKGPFGQAFAALPAAARPRVAVVGLGAGALASYARPAQHWTFFEIDPAVERIARNPDYFTYLRACGSRCAVVIGDARLQLARMPEQSYDLIVLDAFSSDAIPMHLVTSEAMGLYRSRLADRGAIVFHISNRHLKLAPVVARIAAAHGLVALEQEEPTAVVSAGDGKIPSQWMAMAATAEDLGALTHDTRWVTPAIPEGTPLWTDDFTNIFSVLR
ncbi:MAG TPA: fused MFS/spermidine synthase [Vicinamibacterales bacterium]|nr:fused MFS/spermidine synthase [Vicinamibacterales bacterium]